MRHHHAGDAAESAERGFEHAPGDLTAHLRDGLSSDPGSESKADTVTVRDLDSTYPSAADESTAEESEQVESAMSDDEVASRKLVRRFAAHRGIYR